MICRFFLSAVLISVLSGVASPQQALVSHPDFRQLLEKIATFSPDPCGPPFGTVQDSAELESSAFYRAADVLTKDLNAAAVNDSDSALERVTDALKKLKQMSSEINAAWPEEERFRFDILRLPPVLIVKMGLRTQETFFVFGRSEGESGKTGRVWRSISSDDTSEHKALRTRLDLHPLQRGPSQHARFLARFKYGGCAGSTGVAYSAYEWDPEGYAGLVRIIKQDGAFGLDDKVPGFPLVGEFRTRGPVVTLPYCWFSPIDTWDNPSLCAVDTYDISGDSVRFRSHTYNRPDLVPVAKVLEFAQQRDFPAVLGYCASSEVARKLVSEILPDVLADEVRVTPTGAGRERVELGLERTYRFDLAKRAGRWQVVAFSTH